jgi:hypothetical protein
MDYPCFAHDKKCSKNLTWRILSLKMKLWFKVENFPADEVKVGNAKNVKELKQEIIKQHPLMFGEYQEAGLWDLFQKS